MPACRESRHRGTPWGRRVGQTRPLGGGVTYKRSCGLVHGRVRMSPATSRSCSAVLLNARKFRDESGENRSKKSVGEVGSVSGQVPPSWTTPTFDGLCGACSIQGTQIRECRPNHVLRFFPLYLCVSKTRFCSYTLDELDVSMLQRP